MKHTTGYAQPRRLAHPRKKQVRLNLQRRRSAPEPAGELEIEPKNNFWRWVGVVALLHLVAICIVGFYYEASPTPPPPVQFMSLLPPGQVVKGEPGPVEAPKVGATTPAPSVVHHNQPPPEPTPVAIKPAPPVPTPTPPPQPVVKSDAPSLVPVKPAPAKPTPPKPKVKVDLTLQDGPAPTTPAKHVTKPKPHVKKSAPTAVADDTNAPDKDTPSNPNSDGLSKEQIAAKLGQRMQASGTENAVNHGTSGAEHTQANPFQDFYLSVRDQVMSKWTSPNLADETAVTPEVTIHVEKDGRVPPEMVTLTRSSGNQAYDDSAVAAAKSLGYLLQPLPDGCPPDIHINFKLTR
jgi:outer membrane biosynthesis protein TonB